MSMLTENNKAATLVEVALAKLRRDILTGLFAPESKLRIDELRTTYGIGASPLREALSRLVTNGLVTTQGQKGFRIAPVSKADIRDITNTRKLLEREALTESLKNAGPDWEGRVVSAYEHLDNYHEILQRSSGTAVEGWEQANHEFHETLVSACSSKWLLNFRQVVYDQALRYRCLVMMDVKHERGAQDDHRQMLAAAVARDVEKSCQLADAHAERTYNMMASRFSK